MEFMKVQHLSTHSMCIHAAATAAHMDHVLTCNSSKMLHTCTIYLLSKWSDARGESVKADTEQWHELCCIICIFKAQAPTRAHFVFETASLLEWKRRPDKPHVALNQWPVLRRRNCLFTAGSKSISYLPFTSSPLQMPRRLWLPSSKCTIWAIPFPFYLLLLFSFLDFFDWWLSVVLVLICSTICACRTVAITARDGIIEDPPLLWYHLCRCYLYLPAAICM